VNRWAIVFSRITASISTCDVTARWIKGLLHVMQHTMSSPVSRWNRSLHHDVVRATAPTQLAKTKFKILPDHRADWLPLFFSFTNDTSYPIRHNGPSVTHYGLAATALTQLMHGIPGAYPEIA